jgi:DNA-binding NarL/FixJ family response regulator
MTKTGRIRVLCVDDHPIVLEGIASVIGREPDMEVAASATSGREAIAMHRLHRPDVTVMDLQMEGLDGVAATAEIRREYPDSRVIALTVFQGDEDVHRALAAGVAAYVLKDTISQDLVRIVRDVHVGKTPRVPAEIMARLAERASRPSLTQREREVLELVSRGLRNKEIAASLGVSDETVQTHVRSILGKLDVHDRTAAVHVAVRRGIVHLS